MAEIKVGIVGAGGKMGRMLVQAVKAQTGVVLVAASEHMGSATLGRDAGEVAGIGPCGVAIGSSNAEVFHASDVVIDFTTPVATMDNLDHALHHNTALVIGTTGFDHAAREQIRAASQRIPMVMAPNFSIGVNLMFQVASQVAKVLGEEFDIEIIEAHHRFKVDAPSGTAVRLGEVVAHAVDRDLDEVAIYGREGNVGPRDRQTIGFATIRGGSIVGDHTLLFAGERERFEITHKAEDRFIFARGAVKAAQWVAEKNPGLYDMRDILGFR